MGRLKGLISAPGQAHDDQAGEEEHREIPDRSEREAHRHRQNNIQKEEIRARRLETEEESRLPPQTLSLREQKGDLARSEEDPEPEAAQIRTRRLNFVSLYSLFSEIKLVGAGAQPAALHSCK